MPAALIHECLGAFQEAFITHASAAPHQHRNARSDFDDLVVDREIVSRVGFDDVGAEFHCLADQMFDCSGVTVHGVTAILSRRAKHERLDHHGHAVMIRLRFESQDILDAFGMNFRRARDLKEIHANADRVVPHRLKHRVFDHETESAILWQSLAVDIRNIGAQDQRRFVAPGDFLQMPRHAKRELDRIRGGGDDRPHSALHVFDAVEKTGLIEESVIHGHIEAAAGTHIE